MSIRIKKSDRKDILCGRYKKDKKCYVQSHFGTLDIYLFTPATKNVFSSLFFFCTNIECSFVKLKFLFEIFWHFKILFLGSGCRCTCKHKWIFPYICIYNMLDLCLEFLFLQPYAYVQRSLLWCPCRNSYVRTYLMTLLFCYWPSKA